ncbi:hypothetical protein PO909_008786 [Leuciscus waleckii]
MNESLKGLERHEGNACQSRLVPALVRASLPTVPTSLGMKHFFPFRLDSGSTLSLIPSFSTIQCGFIDINKAILDKRKDVGR